MHQQHLPGEEMTPLDGSHSLCKSLTWIQKTECGNNNEQVCSCINKDNFSLSKHLCIFSNTNKLLKIKGKKINKKPKLTLKRTFAASDPWNLSSPFGEHKSFLFSQLKYRNLLPFPCSMIRVLSWHQVEVPVNKNAIIFTTQFIIKDNHIIYLYNDSIPYYLSAIHTH